jgi:hypothetical protein
MMSSRTVHASFFRSTLIRSPERRQPKVAAARMTRPPITYHVQAGNESQDPARGPGVILNSSLVAAAAEVDARHGCRGAGDHDVAYVITWLGRGGGCEIRTREGSAVTGGLRPIGQLSAGCAVP